MAFSGMIFLLNFFTINFILDITLDEITCFSPELKDISLRSYFQT